MAIIFKEEFKKQKNLIYIFAFLIFIILVILWQGIFKEVVIPSAEEQSPVTIKKTQIDFRVLKNPVFEQLQSFEGLSVFPPEEEIGRENPFLK